MIRRQLLVRSSERVIWKNVIPPIKGTCQRPRERVVDASLGRHRSWEIVGTDLKPGGPIYRDRVLKRHRLVGTMTLQRCETVDRSVALYSVLRMFAEVSR